MQRTPFLHSVLIIVVLAAIVLPATVLPANAQPSIDLDLLWEQVQAHPGDFSAACMPLAQPENAVYVNANEAFPLASVSKLLIFVEYARRVDAGLIAQDEQVTLATLNLYDLPGTNRGAHEDFLALYPAGVNTLALWDVAAIGMMQYSSNAAADYVLARLGVVAWDDLLKALGMTSTDPPHALSAIPLLMNNHETGKPTLSGVSALSTTQGTTFFEQYVNDPDWRQAELVYRATERRIFPGWNIQTAILQQHTATGTTTDFLNALRVIYGPGDGLTAGAKILVRSALRWNGYESIDAAYSEYGSKLGFYSGGVLTLVAYGHPYGGQPVISATFLRNIPQRTYYQLLREDSIGDLAHWLNHNTCVGLAEAAG